MGDCCKPVFLRVDGVYCPEATRDPEKAKEWAQDHKSGRVVRVDETTEVEDIKLAEVVER